MPVGSSRAGLAIPAAHLLGCRIHGDLQIAPRLATVRRPPSDFRYGEVSRWIEVAPPGAANTIALVPPSEGKAPGGNQTYCAFASEDIEEDHATLRARGVDVDAGIARKGKRRPGLVSMDVTVRDPVPPQFFFRDLDGNRFLIVGSG